MGIHSSETDSRRYHSVSPCPFGDGVATLLDFVKAAFDRDVNALGLRERLQERSSVANGVARTIRLSWRCRSVVRCSIQLSYGRRRRTANLRRKSTAVK